MSIRTTLNDSIAATRPIFDLEDTVALAVDSLRATLPAGGKVLVGRTGDGDLMTAIGNDYSFELVEPNLAKE